MGTFLIFDASLIFADIIIDNDDPETSYTGIWENSSGSNPYGADSLWARDGATYTWHFSSEESNLYEILMRWTEWPSRASEIPVDIDCVYGTKRVYINQQEGYGQWNSLGEYYFSSNLDNSVTIFAQPFPTSTNADAVWFRVVPIPEPSTIILLSLACLVLSFRKRTGLH